ncbi:MAG: hypothetical protein V1921_06605 [Candidatus Altiarchaeota archaeon]
MTGTKIVKLKLDDEGQADRLPKLKEGIVDDVIRMYEKNNSQDIDLFRPFVRQDIQGFNVSPKQLREILSKLESNFGSSSGYALEAAVVLTYLIMNSTHKEFTIRPLQRLDRLGEMLGEGKTIIVEGKLGHMAGAGMDGGTIIVKGDTMGETGCAMKRGKIVIDGNTGGLTGWKMEGGTLEVRGNVAKKLGLQMSGGSIKVVGDAEDDGGEFMEGGNIEVFGNVGDRLGMNMKGGEIHIKGKCGKNTGLRMNEGKLLVDGRIASISKEYHSGEIWEAGVRRRPK